MSDSVWPHRRQPTRLLCPWDSPGKNTGVSCRCLLQCRKVKSESEVAQSCPTHHHPMDWTTAHQAPLPMGFSRQECWSGVPLSSLSHLVRRRQNLVFWNFNINILQIRGTWVPLSSTRLLFATTLGRKSWAVLKQLVMFMGCHSLLMGIIPTQGLNLGLLHCRAILNHLGHHRRPVSAVQQYESAACIHICPLLSLPSYPTPLGYFTAPSWAPLL